MSDVILAVDDQRENLAVLQGMIGKHLPEAVFLTASSAEEGFARVVEHKPDLMIIDVQMPDINGIEMCRHLKEEATTSSIPVLLITGFHADIKLKEQGYQAGAIDFITKPVNDVELMAKVKVMLRIKRAEDSLRNSNARLEEEVARRTEELQQSEQRYRFLAENARDAIYRMSLSDGRYEYVSAAATELCGYTPEEFYETPFLIKKFIHPDWKDYFKEQWEKLIAGDMPTTYLYQIVHKSGETRWLGQRNTLLCDEEGTPIAIEGVVTDFTLEKKAEEELFMKQTLLNETERLSHIGGWQWDVVNQQMTWTEELYHLHAFSPDDFEPGSETHIEHSLRCYDPGDRQRIQEAFEQCAANGIPYDMEVPFTNANGCRKIIRTTGRAVMEQGRVVRVIGNVIDITESKEAEEALRDRTEKIQSIFRAAPTGIGVVVDRVLTEVNAKFCEMLGYQETELIGQNARMVYVTDEEYEQVGREKYQQIQERGTGTIETRMQHKDGYIIDVLLSSTPLDLNDFSKGVTFTALDISERKQNEERMKRQQYYLLKAQELGKIGTWELDIKKDRLYWTNETCRIYGVTGGNIFDNAVYWERVHPDDREYISNAWEKTLAGQPYDLEHRIMVDGKVKWVHEKADVTMNDEGKATYVIGFTQDITERMEAKLALQETEERIKLAVDGAALGTWDWNIETGEEVFNEHFSRMLGCEPFEVEQHESMWLKLVHPEDMESAVNAIEDHLFGDKPIYESEHRLRHKDGHWIWVHDRGRVLKRDADGKPLRAYGTYLDITHEKEAELALQASEERLDLAVKGSNLGLWDWNIKTGEVPAIERWAQMLDYADNELKPVFDSFIALLHPDDKDRVLTDLYRHVEKDMPDYNTEFRLKSKSGDWKWINSRGKVCSWDEEGQPLRMVGTHIDISERKRIEEAVLASERQLSTLMGNLPGMAYRCKNTKDWSMEFISCGCLELTGYTPEDLIDDNSVSYGSIIHPKDRQIVWDTIQEAKDEKRHFQVSYRIIHANGEERWMWEQGLPILDAPDEEIYLEGFIADITTRKRVEEALRISEERSRLAQQASKTGVWERDLVTNEVFWSDNVSRMFGLESGEFKGDYEAYLDTLLPKDRAHIDHEINAALEKGLGFTTEYRVTWPDGSIHWMTDHAEIFKDDDGNPSRLVGTVRDITEQKMAEEALRESELHLLESQRVAMIGSYIFDVHSGTWKNSPTLDLIFGIDETYERSVEGWLNLVHPDDVKIMESYFLHDVLEEGVTFSKEYRILRHNDEGERWVLGLGKLELDKQGQPITMIGTIQDITERKLAEQELRASTARYRQMFETNQAVKLIIDPEDGRIIEANDAALRYYGYDNQTITMMTIKEINTRSDAEIEDNMKRAINKERLFFDFQHRLASGEIRDVEVYSGPLQLGDKTMLYSIVHDVTDRKLAEQELENYREHLEELVKERTEELARLNAEQQLILDSVRAMILYKDTENRIMRVNKAATEFFGMSAEDIEGKSVADLFPKDAEQYHQGDQEIFTSGEAKLGEIESFHAPNGEIRWVMSDKMPFLDDDGTVNGIIIFSIDITERKQAQEKAERRSKELRSIVKAMAGRENRMIELKKTIKKLHAQIIAEGMTPVASDPILEEMEGEKS